jgi:hypothetical protein
MGSTIGSNGRTIGFICGRTTGKSKITKLKCSDPPSFLASGITYIIPEICYWREKGGLETRIKILDVFNMYIVAMLHNRLDLVKLIDKLTFRIILLETPISEQPVDFSFRGIFLPTYEGEYHNCKIKKRWVPRKFQNQLKHCYY